MVSERVRPLHAASDLASQREALLVAEVALGASVLVVLVATWRRKRWGPALAYALAADCASELWMQGARLYEASFRARVWHDEAFLVTSLVQDGGWSARDEAGAPIGATLANGPFLALRVPEGDHRIVLKYRPPGFGIGLLASAAGLLAAVAGIVRARRIASSLAVR
jgi:Bacterial membrane protein YfhO